MLLSRCNFSVKLTWRSNTDFPFTLKQHYFRIGFVDTQHNFEITYLHLNYARSLIGVFQRCKHLRTKITDVFMIDINDNNN